MEALSHNDQGAQLPPCPRHRRSRRRAQQQGRQGKAAEGPKLNITVSKEASKRIVEPATEDTADGWDRPGPAPRMERLYHETETQRKLAIERVARMTSEVRGDYLEHPPCQCTRRKRRCSTAPSVIGSPLSDAGSVEFPKSFEEQAKPVVIFDWDDTLFPTWYVTEVVQTSKTADPDYARMLPQDSPHWGPLAAHARLVGQTLAIAATYASVAIVTLAARPWVDMSAEWFLPGLDLPEVLASLDIPVFYAREYIRTSEKRLARIEEGVDLYTIAKRNAMKQFLRKRCPSAPKNCNVVCIGDSTTEEFAIKEIMWSEDQGQAFCKTIKLLDDPTLEVLDMELKLIISWFEKMIQHPDDLHISLNDTGTKLVWE